MNFGLLRASSFPVGIVIGLFVAPLQAATTPPVIPANEVVVDLPPLMVEESAAPLRWRIVTYPGLEMLSVCSDATTRGFVHRYHTQTEVLKWILPLRFQFQSSVPDEYILFNENVGRAKSQEVVETMIKNDASRERAKAPGGRPREGRVSDARFGEGERRSRIRFLPNMRLVDVDTTAVFVIVRESAASTTQFNFTLDRIANLLQRRIPLLPIWFMVGTTGLYESANLDDDEIKFHAAVWGSADELEAVKRSDDAPRTLLPMEELFSGRPSRNNAKLAEFDAIWKAQCALFVRWAVAEDKGVRKDALWTFVDRCEKEPVSEALFKSCFGFGYSDMRDILSDYLPIAVDQQLTLKGPKIPKAPPLVFRDATPLDVARLRGDWERIQIGFVRKSFPAALPKYVEQARRTVKRSYDTGERDPRLLAVMGLLECDADNRDGAQEFLQAAAKGNVSRPRVYHELALHRYSEAIGGAGGKNLTNEQIAHIIEPLHSLQKLDPPLPGMYLLLADVWIRTRSEPPVATLETLNHAATLFPHLPALCIRVAQLNVRRGDLTLANQQLSATLPYTTDPALRKMILSGLEEIATATKHMHNGT